MTLPLLPKAEFSTAWHRFFDALLKELEAKEARILALETEQASLVTQIADHETRITALEP